MTARAAAQILALIFVAAVAFGPAVGVGAPGPAPANPAPIKVAVFTFEFEDLAPAAVLLQKPADTAATMEKVTNAAREELSHSGRYLPIDASAAGGDAAGGKPLRDCNGCEAELAAKLGAQQSMIGLVRKVTETDYYVVIRMRDANTGKVLDQQEALFAGDQSGWATGVRMLIRHQVLPSQQSADYPNTK